MKPFLVIYSIDRFTVADLFMSQHVSLVEAVLVQTCLKLSKTQMFNFLLLALPAVAFATYGVDVSQRHYESSFSCMVRYGK